MDQLDALALAYSEKTNYVNIDKAHLIQIQRQTRSAALHLCTQLVEVFSAHAANQPDSRP
jgi:hypothetical protein